MLFYKKLKKLETLISQYIHLVKDTKRDIKHYEHLSDILEDIDIGFHLEMQKFEDSRSKFNLIYNKYLEECENGILTDENRKLYEEKLLEIIKETKESLENIEQAVSENPSEENIGIQKHLKAELEDYNDRFHNLPKDCRIEDVKIFKITFLDDPFNRSMLSGTYEPLIVFASGGDRNSSGRNSKEYVVESIIPDEIFDEWYKLEASGGTIDWGEVGVLSIRKGTKKSKKITLRLEGTAGSYGANQMNYHATYNPVAEARSIPVYVKIPRKGRKKWEKAIWSYTLNSDEVVNKEREEQWGGKFSRRYQEFMNK